MGANAGSQAYQLAVTMLFGAIGGLGYVCAHFLELFTKNRLYLFVADVLSVCFCGVALIFSVCIANDGAYRFFHIIGFVLGFAAVYLCADGLLVLLKKARAALLLRRTKKRGVALAPPETARTSQKRRLFPR